MHCRTHASVQECASSFLPVLPRLIGQPSPSPSGILGCLENKDWAVRRAAGEALRALGLLLGPYFEREGCWDAADPSCVTGWCLQALEKARFDKVGRGRLLQRLPRSVGWSRATRCMCHLCMQ
jgi:hypothetical protein